MAACARGELTRAALVARIGDAAPGWDVALPTFAETPAVIDLAVLRASARPPPPPPVPADLAEPAAIARIAVDASERDDLLYWQAQAVVRRALQALGRARGLAPDDEFWLPLERLLDDTPLSPATAHGHAGAARAAAIRAGAWAWPVTLDDAPATDPQFVGAGVGGVATGPVHHTDGTSAVPPGAVVVARAVTPALALLLDGAAAIVSEHGTPLDHGAAMARELGIPCVVGCAGIYDAVVDGQWLTVAGDAGTVVPAGSPP
ncbi:MAG: PEP-utilizing enzyme [Kofleriaceae bacterium]